MLKSERIRIIRNGAISSGQVVYWMSRDQRADDNWALIYACETAHRLKTSLTVVFCLFPSFPFIESETGGLHNAVGA